MVVIITEINSYMFACVAEFTLCSQAVPQNRNKSDAETFANFIIIPIWDDFIKESVVMV